MNLRAISLACLLPVVVLPTISSQTTFNPGRLTGQLRFVNASSDVTTQCSADPAIASAGALRPVILKSFPYGSHEAATDYTPVNTLTGSNFVLGSYDISPNVPPSGGLFQISTEELRFQSGATYRFGSRYLNGNGAINCPTIFPTTVNPSGTVCDQTECAVRLNIRFRLVSDPLDPPALGLLDSGAAAVPAVCRVIASSVETAGGATVLDQQAASAFVPFPVSSLNGAAYQTIPLLVRGNTNLHVAAQCTAPIAAGQANGFVLAPGTTNMTPLTKESVTTFSCALSGTPIAAPSINIDIPVTRSAGGIRGLLDLAGHLEENARVFVGGLNSPYIAPAVMGATPNDPLTWQLDGVPSGMTPVVATTLADQREKFVMFPARDGLNTRVNIARGATTDLTTTFVATPAEVSGELTLFDKGQADLSTLVTGPFSLFESQYTKTSSQAFAIGNPLMPQTGGASGISGESRGRLVVQTPYTTATGTATFNYKLLLPGIWMNTCSTVGGPACNVTWDFGGDYLMLQPRPDTSENLTVVPAMLMRVDTASQPISHTAPPQSYCIGRAELTVNVDPALGGLFAPATTITSNTSIQPGIVAGTTPVSSVNGTVYQGTAAAQNAASVSLPIDLVAGIGYRLFSWVQFVPASGGPPTFATLPVADVPVTGVMPCGRHPICITSGGPSGSSQLLSVDILDATGVTNPSYCIAAGPITLTAKVNSPTPSSVLYLWDPPAATAGCPAASSTSLCNGASCAANPAFVVTSSALGAGPHSLRVCASDTLSCSVVQDFSFSVTTQNLALSCPAPIVVTVAAGQTSVPRTDPRLAGLRATIAGNCGIPGAISDNAPASFPIGTTTVTFTSPNIPACSTTVTVIPAVLRQFGVRAIKNGVPVLEIYRATTPLATLSQTISVEGAPFDYAFSPDGRRVAIVQNDGLTGVVDLATSGAFFALHLRNMTPSGIGRPLSISWHRGRRAFAVLGKTTTVTGVNATVAVFETRAGARPVRTQKLNVPMPANINASTLLFWVMSYSSDSDRVIMAGSSALTGAPPMYEVIVVSADTDTRGRILTTSFQTATTTPLPVRDDVDDISVNSKQAWILTTIRLLKLPTPGTSLVRVLVLPSIHAVLTAPPPAWIAATEPAGTTIRAALFNIASGLSIPGAPYTRGPNSTGDVAVTRDGLNVAVDSSTGIVVFDNAFNVVSSLNDPTVTGVKFRP